jgi:hypothetical protein
MLQSIAVRIRHVPWNATIGFTRCVESISYYGALFKAVVNLEHLIATGDENNNSTGQDEDVTKQIMECTHLQRIGISMAMAECLQGSSLPPNLKKNRYFSRAWNVVNDWKDASLE